MRLAPWLVAAAALLGCSGGGGGAGTSGGACVGLAQPCTVDANCCNGFFCNRGRCAFGTRPGSSGAGGNSGGISGTTCVAPDVLCDGACIPADQCGVTAGGTGGGSGGSSGGGSSGAVQGTSGFGGGCPVDGGAAGSGCTIFAAPIIIPAGAVQALALGDLNGDGVLDLVAAGGGGLWVSLGGGCGTFGPPLAYGGGADWQALAVGSLRGDAGPPDVAAAQGASALLSVWLNTGNGLLDAGPPAAAGAGPVSLALADMNRDGLPDLVASDRGDGTVAVLLGRGDGTFEPAASWPACAAVADAGCAASELQQLVVVDLNGDGWPDVGVAAADAGSVGVLLNRGDGGLGPATAFATRGVGPQSVATGDLNGDGRPDLLVATAGSAGAAPTLEVFRATDGGSLAPPQSYVVASPPGQLAAAALRSGGLQDVVASEPAAGAVEILLNDGTGHLVSPQSCPAAAGAAALAVGDLNGDGRPDLVLGVAGPDGGAIVVLLDVAP